MTFDLSFLTPALLMASLAIGFFAGFVKGAVGFALPMITIAGLGTFLSPELALAGLILPALVTNLWQALRQGRQAALASMSGHWRFLGILVLALVLCAQVVTLLPGTLLFLLLGILVTIFALIMLTGWSPPLKKGDWRSELGMGTLAGGLGGFSGIWGPPTVMYLTALDIPKTDSVRVQGIIYGFGALALTAAHRQSGILAGDGVTLSLLLIPPALLGLWVGFMLQDRLDQARFRQLTLMVLLIAGLNLIRRGVF